MPADTRLAPAVPEHQGHRLRGRTLRTCDRRCRQHILHRRVHQDVERPHRGHAPNQRQRNIALRIPYLPRDHGQIVPTVVSPKCSHQCGEKSSHATFRSSELGREVRPRSSGIRKAHRHNSEDDRNLQQREQKLKFSRPAHPNVIQPRNQNGGSNCRNLPVVDCEWMRHRCMGEENMREKREDRKSFQDPHQPGRDGRDRSRLGDQKPGP